MPSFMPPKPPLPEEDAEDAAAEDEKEDEEAESWLKSLALETTLAWWLRVPLAQSFPPPLNACSQPAGSVAAGSQPMVRPRQTLPLTAGLAGPGRRVPPPPSLMKSDDSEGTMVSHRSQPSPLNSPTPEAASSAAMAAAMAALRVAAASSLPPPPPPPLLLPRLLLFFDDEAPPLLLLGEGIGKRRPSTGVVLSTHSQKRRSENRSYRLRMNEGRMQGEGG